MRKLIYWLAGLALIGVAIGAVLLLSSTREISWAAAESALCQPTLADAGGVDQSSAFRFTFADVVSANAIRRFLSVEPAIELNYHQGLRAKEVLAVPLEPLQAGIIYRFSLQTEAETLYWAFQTKQEWRVEAARPAGGSAVPPDSPLYFIFNQSLSVDLDKLADYFSIEPYIPGSFMQAANCLQFVPAEPFAPRKLYTVRLSAGLPALDSNLTLAETYSIVFETANADGSMPPLLWYTNPILTFKPQQTPFFDCFFVERDTAWQEAAPTANATLYRYPDAEAYAEDILFTRWQALPWNNRGINPQDADTAALTRLATYELPVQAMDNYYRFSWPAALPLGCYLLQANYSGQSCDIRFQVSTLNASLQSYKDESLFWVHRADGGPAAACLVTHINSGAKGQTDEEGLLHLRLERGLAPLDQPGLQHDKEDVYLLRHGADELVLMGFLYLEAQETADSWQYTVLSRDIYSSGDTLEFWGYLRRRDNTAWTWSRVSIYVYAKDAPQEPVLQSYAPISGNIFQGSLQLPLLKPGGYELQIWQSGQMLAGKGFTVGGKPNDTGFPAAENDLLLTGDKGAYDIGEEYTLNLTGRQEYAGPYLFVKSANGIKKALVEREARYKGVFDQEDLGGAYWQAAIFAGGQYLFTPQFSLLPQSRSHSLIIEADASESSARFTVRDASGAIPAKAALLALIAPPGRPAEDAAAILYAPNRHSGLLGEAFIPGSEPFNSAAPAAWAGEAACFAALETDKNGRAELKLPDDLPPGQWQLYVWAVVDAPLPLAGSLQLPLATVTADAPAPPSPAAGTDWIFAGNSLRVQAVELLSEIRLAAKDSSSVSLDIKKYWAALYAGHVLASLCPGDLPLTTEKPPPAWAGYQQPDGGISPQPGASADMLLSLLAASLESQGAEVCDRAALRRYLKARVTDPATLTDRAMALTGLAALGEPVLQEIKLMLTKLNLPLLERACLIWGLAQAGDIQVAKAAIRDFSYDAVLGGLYVEGGEEDRLLLNSLGLLAAAACGEAQTAYDLLQYLQSRQEPSPLITALTAGALLRHHYAKTANATLSTSFVLQRIEIKGLRDFWLKLSEPSSVELDNISGDIIYTIIRR